MAAVRLLRWSDAMSLYLVLGGTGKTGRRVVNQRVAAGHTARAAARTPGPATNGIEPVQFDWADPATHGPALEKADGVYIVPGARFAMSTFPRRTGQRRRPRTACRLPTPGC